MKFKIVMFFAALVVGSLAHARLDPTPVYDFTSIDPYQLDDYYLNISRMSPSVVDELLNQTLNNNGGATYLTNLEARSKGAFFVYNEAHAPIPNAIPLKLEGNRIVISIEALLNKMRAENAWSRQTRSRQLVTMANAGVIQNEKALAATMDFVAYTAMNSQDGYRTELYNHIVNPSTPSLPKVVLIEKLQSAMMAKLKGFGTINPNLLPWLVKTVANFTVVKGSLDPENQIYQRQEAIMEEAKRRGLRCDLDLTLPADQAARNKN